MRPVEERRFETTPPQREAGMDSSEVWAPTTIDDERDSGGTRAQRGGATRDSAYSGGSRGGPPVEEIAAELREPKV